MNHNTTKSHIAMTGKEQIDNIAEQLKFLAEHNPCGMGDDVMELMAKAIKSLLDSFIAVDMSREQAANYLGISTRTLGRLVEEGLIAQPKRRGFRNKAYSKKSLDEYLQTRK